MILLTAHKFGGNKNAICSMWSKGVFATVEADFWILSLSSLHLSSSCFPATLCNPPLLLPVRENTAILNFWTAKSSNYEASHTPH